MKNKTANQKFTCDSTSLIDMQAVLDSHHKNAWIHFHSLFCESSFDAVIIVVFINGDKFTECWRTTIDRSIDRLNDVGMMMKCQWGVDQIHGDGWMDGGRVAAAAVATYLLFMNQRKWWPKSVTKGQRLCGANYVKLSFKAPIDTFIRTNVGDDDNPWQVLCRCWCWCCCCWKGKKLEGGGGQIKTEMNRGSHQLV